MKEDFLNQLIAINKQELSKLPKYVTMLSIRDSLMNKNISLKDANTFVNNMKIDANQNFIDDKEFMEKSIDIFSDIIVKLHKQMIEDCLFDSIQSIAGELSFEVNL